MPIVFLTSCACEYAIWTRMCQKPGAIPGTINIPLLQKVRLNGAWRSFPMTVVSDAANLKINMKFSGC